MTAAELIIKCLEDHGVEYIFGIPGGALEPLNNALYKSKIKVIVTKHEEGAAFMADGYARLSGKIGVCCGTSGPGATNLITGIASSYADSIPVLVLTGQVSTSVFGKGAVQEFTSEWLSIVDMFRSITKYSDMIINEKKTQEMVSRALRTALTGRTGPVHLNLPTDIMKREVSYKGGRISIGQAAVFDREGVKKAARLLLSAKRPVMIAGWGTVLSRADKELLELSEMMDIPVATSQKGKGIFNELHPLSLGVLGFAGSPIAKKYIMENSVDVMLAIGTSFNEWMTSGWDERLLPSVAKIQLDIDPDEIGKNYPVTVGIVGDAKVVLRELIYELKRQGKKISVGDRRQREAKRLKKKFALIDRQELIRSGGMPYKPQRLMKDLMDSLPENAIYFADNGNSMAWAIRYINILEPYSFYVPLGFASMGYAVASPVGAKLASPERPVITLVGDGGFLMNGMEVATASNYKIPVIWVIMNNSMLGMVYHARKLASLPEGIPSRFKRVDFVKIAEGLGARGIRITKPGKINRKMINDIISSGVPTVLDVIIDPEEVPPIHSRIKTLDSVYT
ncbi:MAG: thiamine pyrophosphate-binding protein [Nitrospirae bacterium]|nr:thiamine pyrophosphate-binding protein [Nitrospirota bacterium]MCL5976591.1 thiamine pyrophosphate-binding protein [Nitrospirota bacterium]